MFNSLNRFKFYNIEKKIFLFSDDGEREDSDNETHPSPRRNPGISDRREYRDTMETIDRVAKPISITTVTNSSSARNPRIIKKIDLGAAANFGKEQPSVNLMSSPITQQSVSKSKNDILNDIFDSQNDNNGTSKTLILNS